MTSLVNLSPLPSSCPMKLIPRLTTGPIAQSTNYLDLLPPTPSIYPWLADRDNYNPLKWNWPSDRNWQGWPFFGQLVSDIWWGLVMGSMGDSGNFMIFFPRFIFGLQLMGLLCLFRIDWLTDSILQAWEIWKLESLIFKGF